MTLVGHKSQFYEPHKSDIVIGIVKMRMNEEWLVDISSSHLASLPQLSFEGASKKNYPKFEKDSLVAAVVEDVPKPDEVLLTCMSKKYNLIGKLNDGTLLRCRNADIQRIIEYKFLDKISGEKLIGKNGRIFIKGKDEIESLRIVNCILEALKSNNPEEMFNEMLNQI